MNSVGAGNRRRVRRRSAAIMWGVGVLVLALAMLALDQPRNPWIGLIGALVLAAATIWFAIYGHTIRSPVVPAPGNQPAEPEGSAPEPEGSPTPAKPQPHLLNRRVLPASLVLVYLLAGLWLWQVAGPPVTCPHPTELRILTSPDGLASITEIAGDYAVSTAGSHGCPAVFPFVYAAPIAEAVSALARGWRPDETKKNPLVTLGPRPDVWLPDSTLEVRRVLETVTGKAVPRWIKKDEVVSIATSPIVLSVDPDDGAASSGSWPGAVPRLVENGMTMLAPDPENTVAGLLAADGYLRDSRRLLVQEGLAAQRHRALSAAGGGVAQDSATMLCRHGRTAVADEGPVAILTSLHMWRRFQAGRPLGDGCHDSKVFAADLRSSGPPQTMDNAPALDYPFVAFTWTSNALRPAVDAFRHWLSAPAGQEKVKAAGFDGVRLECSTLDGENPCAPSRLDETRELAQRARTPGNVLLALDASGSMKELVGGAGRTRLQIATDAVRQAVDYMGQPDRFGLQVFPAAQAGQPLVPLSDGTAQQRKKIDDVLRAVRPGGNTPLYDTVIAGIQAVAATDPNSRRALVILTDGEDTSSRAKLSDAAEAVRAASKNNVQIYVIATGDARCARGLQTLADTGRGQCREASLDRLPGTMRDLFVSLWSGR